MKRTSVGRTVSLLVSSAVLLTLLFASTASTAAGRSSSETGGGSTVPARSEPMLPETRAAAEFADEVLPRQLRAQRIPGAAVAIVSDHGTMLRGYGTADRETGRAVDAERTVFAPASVAKLLTATAVMQLVEEGRLELDEDVNSYLRHFRIEDGEYAGQPITVEHLLTHTAGFAGGDSGTAAATASDVRRLGAHLKEQQPARVRPPGTTAVYSNYGMALAGYLVEERSGMPFHRYVERHILRPLGMRSTTFAQPESASIAARLATGYLAGQSAGMVPTTAANYGHMPPHGAGFRSTAADMAKFLRAHLEGGRGIVEPESARMMQRRQFGNAAGTAGMGYGFWEYTLDGNRLLVHRGSIPGYLAIFAMLPEQGIGIYASYNSTGRGGGSAAWELVDEFVDRFADSTTSRRATPGDLPDPARFTGRYGSLQAYDSDDLGRLQALTGGVSVSTGPSGDLVTNGPVTHLESGEKRWVQIAPGLFRAHDGQRTIRFVENGILATENPAGPLRKLSWYERPAPQLGALLISVAVLLGSTIAWPVVHLLRTRGRQVPRWSRLAELSGWLVGVLVLASVGSLVMMFANFEQNQGAYFRGSSPLLSVVTVLPKVALITVVLAVGANLLAWRRGWWGAAGRLHQAVVVMAAGSYLAFAATYHILG